MVPAGCMSDVTEMECGRSEIDELIKEVSVTSQTPSREGQTSLLPLTGIERLRPSRKVTILAEEAE